MNQILLILGLKPEGFRAGLRQASDDVKGFERTWKNLGKLFALGGISTLAFGFFRGLIEHAREATGEIDEATAAMRRAGDGLEAMKKFGMDVGVQVFGTIADWVQKAAIGLASFVYGTEAAATALGEMESEAARALDAERVKRLAAAEEDLAKSRRTRALQEAQGYEKLTLLIQREIELKAKVSSLAHDKAAQLKVQNELEAVQLDLRRTAADITKKEEAEAKAASAERQKAHEATRLEKEAEEEMTRLLLKGANNLTAEEHRRLKVLQLQVQQKRVQAEIDEILSKPPAERTADDNKRLKTLYAQSDALNQQVKTEQSLLGVNKDQVKTEQQTTGEVKKQKEIVEEIVLIKRRGNPNNTELTDRQLAEKASNLLREVAADEAFRRQTGFSSPFGMIARDELAAVEAEQLTRQQFRALAAGMGLDRALATKSAFEEDRYRGYVEERTEAAKQTLLLNEINERMRVSGQGLNHSEVLSGLNKVPDKLDTLVSATVSVAQQLSRRGIDSP